MSELEFHRALAQGVIATGAAVFVVLFFVDAPYGRARGDDALRERAVELQLAQGASPYSN